MNSKVCEFCPSNLCTGHGIPEEEIEQAFATGRGFLELEKEVKTAYPFNPDSYLGHRGPDELETVTGGSLTSLVAAVTAGLQLRLSSQ